MECRLTCAFRATSPNSALAGSGLIPRDMRNHRTIELPQASRAELQDVSEARPDIAQEPFNLDAKRHRSVRLKESEGVREQVHGALLITAQNMMKARGDLDDSLVEVSQRTLFALASHFSPDIFESLVAMVKAPIVELGNTLRERLSRPGGEIGQREASGHRHQCKARQSGRIGWGGR